uniref:Uncharacterized protein n=1 Tax=Leersia perrieri TaxID=77586 RepID=A0A0D9WY53_9ORYZ
MAMAMSVFTEGWHQLLSSSSARLCGAASSNALAHGLVAGQQPQSDAAAGDSAAGGCQLAGLHQVDN